jgi:hypothetical protein
MTPLKYALDLARGDTLVLPCSARETLLIELNDASRDPTTIRGWWERWPVAVPATPTGRVSGLVVIAVADPDLTRTSRTWYEDHRGVLSTTRIIHTPRGGRIPRATPSLPAKRGAE